MSDYSVQALDEYDDLMATARTISLRFANLDMERIYPLLARIS